MQTIPVPGDQAVPQAAAVMPIPVQEPAEQQITLEAGIGTAAASQVITGVPAVPVIVSAASPPREKHEEHRKESPEDTKLEERLEKLSQLPDKGHQTLPGGPDVILRAPAKSPEEVRHEKEIESMRRHVDSTKGKETIEYEPPAVHSPERKASDPKLAEKGRKTIPRPPPLTTPAAAAQSTTQTTVTHDPTEITKSGYPRRRYDEVRRQGFEEFLALLKRSSRVLIIGPMIRAEVVEAAQAVGTSGLVYGIKMNVAEGPAEPTVPELPVGAQDFPWNELFTLLDTWVIRMNQGQMEKFDAIFLPFTVAAMSLQDAMDMLNQCRKVLKPEGQLTLISVVRENDPTETLGALFRWLGKRPAPYYRPVDAKNYLAQAGFRVETVTHIYPQFPSLPVQIYCASPEAPSMQQARLPTGKHAVHEATLARQTA